MDRRHRIAVFVACLLTLSVALVVSVGAMPVGSDQSQTAEDDITDDEAVPTYLSPSPAEVEQESQYATGLDVSTAVTVDVERLSGNLSRAAHEMQAEADPAETAADIEDRIEQLDDTHERILGAYNDGEIATGTFLREVLRIHVAATEKRQFAERYTDSATKPAIVSTGTLFLDAPVTASLDPIARGERPPTPLYVLTSADGIVLADPGESFLRQATIRSYRDLEAPDQFEGDDRISLIQERMNELYPWAQLTGWFLKGSGLYEVEMTHDVSQLILYLDGGTTDVFQEIQEVSSSELAISATSANTTDGLTVEVETTQATGPMRVTVTEEGTEQPVEATVSVNGTPLGSTGLDGSRWFVQPRDTIDVTVETDDGRAVSVSGP